MLPKHNINELLSGCGEELTRRKEQKSQAICDLIEKEGKFMRFRKIFWAWMESVLNNDKKQYKDEDGYGFED